MALFNKKTIKIELEGRDQTIEMLPIPIGAYANFQKKFRAFQEIAEKAKDTNNDKDAKKSIETIADLLASHIVNATREDILDPESGFDMEDVGFLLGRLLQASQSPKV